MPDGRGVTEVALLWGDRLLDVRQFRRGARPTLKRLPGDVLHAFAQVVGGDVPLIRDEHGERLLCIPRGVRVSVHAKQGTADEAGLRAEGRLRPDDSRPAWELTLRQGERAEVALGGLRLSVREVMAGPRVRALLLRGRDFSFFKLASITALISAAVIAVLMLPGISEPPLDDSIFHEPPGVVVFKPARRELPKPVLKDEVQRASPAALPTDAPSRAVTRSRPKRAGDVGLLAAMKEAGGLGSGLFAGGGLDEKLNAALGNLRGGAGWVGDATGLHGLGSRGSGPGGPGEGFGHLGGIGTRGSGGPHAIGLPGGGMRSRVVLTPEKTRIEGGLDRDQIARVIQRHQSEIKYCYESALSQSPELAGKVAVQFVIDPAGRVADAMVSESTIGSDPVERCMLQKVRTWRFPEPRGGGVVSVNFPWLFRPVGAGTTSE